MRGQSLSSQREVKENKNRKKKKNKTRGKWEKKENIYEKYIAQRIWHFERDEITKTTEEEEKRKSR